MIARIFVQFAGSFLVLLIVGCSTIRDVKTVSWLKAADPRADFEAAAASGDLRFFAVNGVAAGMTPGVNQSGSDGALLQAHGTRMIRGTSDTGNHRLNDLAWRYATAYNTLLLRHLHANNRKA